MINFFKKIFILTKVGRKKMTVDELLFLKGVNGNKLVMHSITKSIRTYREFAEGFLKLFTSGITELGSTWHEDFHYVENIEE